jgi:hypothetical protein
MAERQEQKPAQDERNKEPQLVHIQSVRAVLVEEVNDEMVWNLLEMTGFMDEYNEDGPIEGDAYKPRVERRGRNRIVRFYSHGNARFFLEEILGTGAHRVDWYLEPGQQLDMNSREVDEED